MFGAVRRDDPQVSLSVNHVSVFFSIWFRETDTCGLYSPSDALKAAVCTDSPAVRIFFFFKTDDFNCHFQFDL